MFPWHDALHLYFRPADIPALWPMVRANNNLVGCLKENWTTLLSQIPCQSRRVNHVLQRVWILLVPAGAHLTTGVAVEPLRLQNKVHLLWARLVSHPMTSQSPFRGSMQNIASGSVSQWEGRQAPGVTSFAVLNIPRPTHSPRQPLAWARWRTYPLSSNAHFQSILNVHIFVEKYLFSFDAISWKGGKPFARLNLFIT